MVGLLEEVTSCCAGEFRGVDSLLDVVGEARGKGEFAKPNLPVPIDDKLEVSISHDEID